MEDYFKRFFRGTVNATYNRCLSLESKLENVKTPPVLNEYMTKLQNNLREIKTKLNELIQDPNFGHDFLINQHYSRYYRLSQELSLLESYPITVISRLNDDDLYFYNLMGLFNKTINYPYSNPLVTTYCMTYFASHPGTELLIIPFVERDFLLDIPFLLHELGHIILHKKEKEILERFIQDLRKYIIDEKNRVEEEDRSPEYKDRFSDLEIIWEESWSKEFASDLIATYLLGPAYGWSYLKTCSRFSKEIYSPGSMDDLSSDHPSHESRMRCILEMLKLLEIDISSIQKHWNEYIKTIRDSPPQEYEQCYPNHLLKSIAKNVLEGCKNLGLRCYNEQEFQPEELNLIVLINESFNKFLEDPSEFRKWEIKQIGDIDNRIINLTS